MANDAGVGQVGFGFGEVAAAPEPLSREQRRSRRKREVRSKVISINRLAKREVEMGRLMFPEVDYARPETRGECLMFRIECGVCQGQGAPNCARCGGSALHFIQNVGAAGHWRVRDRAAYDAFVALPIADRKATGLKLRPCAFVSCAHHLYLDVSDKTKAIKLNFPDLEVEDMKESCAADVADRSGETLEEVGAIMNLTRERIRQLEVKSLAKLLASGDPALVELAEQIRAESGKRRLPVLQDRDGRERRALATPGEVDEEMSDDDGLSLYAERPEPQPAVAEDRASVAQHLATFAREAGVNEARPVDRREAALLRAAERLRRAPATALLRLAGLGIDDVWILGPAVARGVIRREGEDVVWVGQQVEAAE